MESFQWRPFFPVAVIVVLTVVLVVAALVTYWRQRHHGSRAAVLFLLRLLGIFSVTWVLMGPSIRIPNPVEDDRQAASVVLLDQSQSMLTEDMSGQSRWAFALSEWVETDLLDALQAEGDLRMQVFDRETSSVKDASSLASEMKRPEGGATYLMTSLESVLDLPVPVRRILLISDGHDSLGDSPAAFIQSAVQQQVKVDTVTLGGPQLQKDVHLSGFLPQPYLIVEEEGVLRVSLMQVNCEGLTTTLRVTHQGQTRTFPVRFDDSGHRTIEIPIQHAEPGAYTYLLQVDALPGEVEERNNHQTVLVDVTPARFRVLMLEGQPFWDTKFLAQSLRKDDRLELMQVSQIASGRREILLTRMDADQAVFPTTLDELAGFDVVILGREIENVAGESWLALLPDYVRERGGNILFSRGRAFDPNGVKEVELIRELKRLEPVMLSDRWIQNVPFLPTARGGSHPIFSLSSESSDPTRMFAELPGMGYAQIAERAPGAKVLAEFDHGEGRFPALVTQQNGMGQTMMMLGEGSWRWRLPDTGRRGLSNVHSHFWINTVRWLQSAGEFMPGSDIALRAFPRHVRVGEDVTLSIASRAAQGEDAGRHLWVIHPSGKREELAISSDPGGAIRSEIQWRPETEGLYNIRLDVPGYSPPRLETLVNVFAENTERLQSSARPDVMRLLAEETGGQVLDPYRPEAYSSRMAILNTTTEGQPQMEWLWNEAWILIGIAMCFGGEWILRRWWGLE